VNYADYYQVRGYNRNDLVGSSFLEQYYEDVLRGQKGEEVYLVDKAGVVLEKKGTIAGKRGLDLVLTFDLQLQNEIEKIVEEELIKGMANPKNPYLNSAYVVMMDPNTGEVLSLVGKKFVEDGFTNKALDTITKSFEMGSAIKGATMLTGYETGVIKPGQYIIDAPIVFRDANKTEKKSHKTMGRINDYTALEWSSNVYMFKIAMKIAQYDLENNTQVLSNQQAYQIMRNLFSQFGLGVKTEIDLPMEATGYEGPISNVTKLMDLAIGQYDTYTPLQMGQYISTIANSGYRMKPYLVKAIKEVNPQKDYEKIIYETKPKVLNKIPMDQELIKRVQHGFWLVMHGDPKRATARSFFVDKPYNPAGKTGTAEVYVRDDDSGAYLRNEEDELIESVNSTLVGYAPYENPEIAFVVIVPYAESGAVSKFIGSRVLDAYFNYQPTKEQ
jgi:penicillin-binding protein A